MAEAKGRPSIAGAPVPFDRLLVAQAISEKIPLMTCDEEIVKSPLKTLW